MSVIVAQCTGRSLQVVLVYVFAAILSGHADSLVVTRRSQVRAKISRITVSKRESTQDKAALARA